MDAVYSSKKMSDDIVIGFCLGTLGFGSLIFCSQGGPSITCGLYVSATGLLFILATIKFLRERKNGIRWREVREEKELFLEQCRDHARY